MGGGCGKVDVWMVDVGRWMGRRVGGRCVGGGCGRWMGGWVDVGRWMGGCVGRWWVDV